MGWFDKHKQPDGKSGDDQSKAEMDAMFERFGQIVDERVKPLSDGFTALKTDWETIKAEATKPPVVDTRPRDENGNVRELTPEEKQRNLNIALVDQNVQNAARFIERDAIDSLTSDWKHLAPHIREVFQQTPVARKAQPDYAEYCNNCVELMIGREAKKAGLRRKENGDFFLEDKSTSTGPDSILNDPSLSWKSPDGLRELSAHDQLRKLGIDPKEFEENAKKGLV